MENSKFEILDWDSSFFNLNIAKIQLNSIDAIKNITSQFHNSNLDLLYLFVKGDVSHFSFNKEFNLNLVDVKYTYEKNLNKNSENLGDTKIKEITRYLDNLYELAYLSGHSSRFKTDTNFKKGEFERLYREWIDNSINHKISDYILGYFEEKKLIGFITLKIKEDRGEIGLFAVDENYQGKGIGKKLIEEAERITYREGKNKLQMATQKDNINACNFYKKVGYTLQEVETIYHLWHI